MLAVVLMLVGAADSPRVIATFSNAATGRDKLVAEQIERPADSSAEAFAAELVEAEGLKSWSPQDPTRSPPGAKLAWRARHAGDGREIIVYYDPAVRTLCRIRRPRGGATEAHYQAVRWCAASLGVAIPAKPPAPIR